MDKAVIASLVATMMAVAALGVTTWLSFRFSGAVRAQEHAVIDRYRGAEEHSVQLERDVAAARERAAALEQEVSTARGRSVALEQEVSTARERSVALEQEVSAARERAASLEQEAATARERALAFERTAREASEQAARAADERAGRESPAAGETARSPMLDATEIQQRLGDVGKLVREATARGANPAPGSAAEAPRPTQGPAQEPAQGEVAAGSTAASRDGQPLAPVSGLRKYAGAKAAVFVLDQVSDASSAGATVSATLGDAGWVSQTWSWSGVAGIMGVVVLVKEGSDPATVEAASALVEDLRSRGFNATKGDWPADWRRFRGALYGPQTPGPTEAPIRIVVGGKPR